MEKKRKKQYTLDEDGYMVETIGSKYGHKEDNWEVLARGSTKKEMEEYYRENGEDSEDYGLEEIQEVEIAIVRKNNKLGHESYGWPGKDKIILADNEVETKKDFEWWKKVAGILCEALNTAGV